MADPRPPGRDSCHGTERVLAEDDRPFSKISSSTQLFDSTRTSLGALLTAAGGQPNSSPGEIVDLLAGPPQNSPDGLRVHQELARRIRAVLEDQHLVSLDTLFSLSDGLNSMEQGKPADGGLLPLAGELREFEMPRPIFTKSEKIDWAPRRLQQLITPSCRLRPT